MRERICGIYKITNRVNGKIYIGQSRNIHARWIGHKTAATNPNSKKDSVLYNAMRKYGIENFEIEVIEECLPEQLDDREIFYIKEYKSCIKDNREIGYNMNFGGSGNNGYGKPVCQYSLDGKYIKTFPSAAEAEREIRGKEGTSITNCCYGRILSWCGYMWRFEGDTPPQPYKDTREKEVSQYGLDGNFIKTFDSMALAAKEMGCYKTQISQCCRNRTGSCYGYQWRFAEDSPPDKYIHHKNARKILQFTADGKFVAQYPSRAEAAEAMKVAKGYISHCCKTGGIGVRGYIWAYEE